MLRVRISIIIFLLLPGSLAMGLTRSWPAESNTSATLLTLADAALNDNNMSGAFWNPDTRTLWLANNYGRFFAMVEDGFGGFKIPVDGDSNAAKWYSSGDFEGVTQADLSEDVIFILDENGWIREYDVSSYGVVDQNGVWDIRAECPEVNGSGPEGITFVPDVWLLSRGFQDANGSYYSSVNGMGGLIFIGHQSGGYVHVFDLNRSDRTYIYVGRYITSRSETAGLEFDRSTGKLYIWHNTGSNYLELSDLGSQVEGSSRRLNKINEYYGPRSGNLEGFALMPTPEGDNWCFIVDDNNLNNEAVVWYKLFDPFEIDRLEVPAVSITIDLGLSYPTFEYRYRNDGAVATYRIETSSDLVTWTERFVGVDLVTVGSDVVIDNYTRTKVRFNSDYSSVVDNRLFFRIEVIE